MSQTLALLVDAYRELNARKMFWISLIVSAVVIAAFALLGVKDDGLSILGLTLPVRPPMVQYKSAFSTLVVGVWVSKGAMILALISTASIFPELMAGGSIDLYLSKPIGRLRLFLVKYLGGLLFVLLQVTVFTLGCYLVFGLRTGQWLSSLLLVIPLATLLFSYLFAVCVLVGVTTRSTLAAILITCVFWVICMVGNLVERGLFMTKSATATQARVLERQVLSADTELADLQKHPSVLNAFGFRERRIRERQERDRAEAAHAREIADKIGMWYGYVYLGVSFIPKTGETIDLLDRKLFTDEDVDAAAQQRRGPFGAARDEEPPPPIPVVEAAPGSRPTTGVPTTGPSTGMTATQPDGSAAVEAAEDKRDRELRHEAQSEVVAQAARDQRSRSVPWIVGTSVAFEVVVLGVAAWVFCRRDY